MENTIETAVERYFVPAFEAQQRFPMNEESSKMMITLLFSKRPNGELPADMMKDIREKSMGLQILENRLNALGYECEDTFLVFMCTMFDTPGTAVMYGHYIAYKAKKSNVKRVSLKFICEHCFPFGFPNDAGLSKAWDAQKSYDKEEFKGIDVHGANLLDYAPANTSIMYKSDPPEALQTKEK